MTEPVEDDLDDPVWWLTGDRPAPDARARRWVERVVGPGSRVTGTRTLTGGISSYVDLVGLDTPAGPRRVVLRRLRSGAEWEGQVEDEQRVLAALAGSGVPVPEVLGVDPTGSGSGWPALLMTHLPGRVELAPADLVGWVDQQVATLVGIHDLAVDPGGLATSRHDVGRAAAVRRPTRPDLWRAALEVGSLPAPEVAPSLVHHDYQHFNLLWRDGRVSGVLDWAGAGRGPGDLDVAHARLNLALLHSVELAERFRLRYEAETGRPTEAWFDVAELLGWNPEWRRFVPLQVGGRAPFDAAGCDDRVDELLRLSLARA